MLLTGGKAEPKTGHCTAEHRALVNVQKWSKPTKTFVKVDKSWRNEDIKSR